MLSLLNGNGRVGVITKLALCEEKFKNLPSPRTLKLYALMSGGAVSCVAFIGYLLIQSFKAAGGG